MAQIKRIGLLAHSSNDVERGKN